jgi:hypothetical protein
MPVWKEGFGRGCSVAVWFVHELKDTKDTHKHPLQCILCCFNAGLCAVAGCEAL